MSFIHTLTLLAGTHAAQAVMPIFTLDPVPMPPAVRIQYYGPPPGYYAPPVPHFYPRGEGEYVPYPRYMPPGGYMRPDDWGMIRRYDFDIRRRHYGPPMGW